MKEFMYGVGFATGLIITGVLVISWALKREYTPMCERPYPDDEWGEWVNPFVYSSTFN